MAEICTVFDQAVSTRLNDPEKGFFVAIGQRLHSRDLPGYLLGHPASTP